MYLQTFRFGEIMRLSCIKRAEKYFILSALRIIQWLLDFYRNIFFNLFGYLNNFIDIRFINLMENWLNLNYGNDDFFYFYVIVIDCSGWFMRLHC